MNLNYQKINQVFFIFIILLLITSSLNIDENLTFFISDYFTIILLILLFSLSLIVHELFSILKTKQMEKENYNDNNKTISYKLSKLSYEEKNILSLFMANQTQEKSLIATDQAVSWLENIKFIYKTGKIDGNKHIFRIDPLLAKHLKHNPNNLY